MATPTDVPTGQTPLTEGPQWGGTGGGQEAAAVYAFNQFAKTFGRNPSQQELDQLIPAYIGADKNIANISGGNANVAAYYQQLTNTPQNIYNTEQQKYLTDAPKFADQVTQAFQQSMGRAPTQDELSHFGALMASGQDQYQVQNALAQTQEAQNTANTTFQNQLQGQLQGSNKTYFDQYILPSIQAQNAQAGRTQDSSGYQSQLANAALQQNQGLQNFLASTTAQNYQNSTANAAGQYNQLLGQQYGLQNAGVSSGLANQAANQQYNQNLNMYQMQQQAYNNYLNQYGKRNNGTAGLIGGGVGAIAGAFVGGPAGAAAGYGIGSSLGSQFGGGSYGQGYQPPQINYSGLSNSWGRQGMGGKNGTPEGLI